MCLPWRFHGLSDDPSMLSCLQCIFLHLSYEIAFCDAPYMQCKVMQGVVDMQRYQRCRNFLKDQKVYAKITVTFFSVPRVL